MFTVQLKLEVTKPQRMPTRLQPRHPQPILQQFFAADRALQKRSSTPPQKAEEHTFQLAQPRIGARETVRWQVLADAINTSVISALPFRTASVQTSSELAEPFYSPSHSSSLSGDPDLTRFQTFSTARPTNVMERCQTTSACFSGCRVAPGCIFSVNFCHCHCFVNPHSLTNSLQVFELVYDDEDVICAPRN